MKKYTPRIIFYAAMPLLALASIPFDPNTITAPLISTWFGFLMMTLYFIDDPIDIDRMWIIRIFKSPPKHIFSGIIFIGLIGLIVAAISKTSALSYIFMTFIFIALELIFRKYEQQFISHRNDKN
ncbi:MAG: hypothetical protein RR311_04225 [Comamonas sp.]